MSTFIKHLFLESLFASGVLLVGKIIGVIGGLWITGTTFSLTQTTNIIPTLSITLQQETALLQVNSLSNIIFLVFVLLFASIAVSKIYLSHEVRKNKKLAAKIIYYNLADWVENGESIYSKLFAWAIFLWLSAILVLRDSLIGISWNGIAIIAITFAAVYSAMIFLYIEKRIQLISFHRSHGKKRATVKTSL
ncbi:MAG: hypothetical protein QY314_00970 [Candidatus Dojkabacteria bacterium]|nr:MAG: hypothetical protein QY314_00970 [Candidatus Dojkabacteria bacterium]